MKKAILFATLIFLVTVVSAQSIKIDGSSTVFPLTDAINKMYAKTNPGLDLQLDVSGTGGGFKRFVTGETDINNSSREPKASEIQEMTQNGIEAYQLALALDGIAIVVNQKNYFAKELSMNELRAIWRKGTAVKTWRDVRPNWPDKEIILVGPGKDSGTRDFFGSALFGDSKLLRDDYKMSEDDDELEELVEASTYSTSFFGIAYVTRHGDKVQTLPIEQGGELYEPTFATIYKMTYPLSRMLYLHINKQKYANSIALQNYISYYMRSIINMTRAAGYIPLNVSMYRKSMMDLKEIRENLSYGR